MAPNVELTRTLRLVVGIQVVLGAALTTAQTYVDMLFLSTYPATWLPAFFLAKTALLIVVTFAVNPLVSQGTRRTRSVLLAGCAAAVTVGWLALGIDLVGFEFGLALWLEVVILIVGVTAWNTTADAFDIRTFKQVGRWVNSAPGVGGMLMGLSIPIVIRGLGSDAMLPLLAGLIALLTAGLYRVTPIATSAREQARSASPGRYRLFVVSMVGIVLLLGIDTFADFTLKTEVGRHFERDEIGGFLGPLYGAASAATIAVQFLLSGVIVRRFGLRGLLLGLPAFTLIAGIVVWVFPGVWAAAMFRSGELVLRRSLDGFGQSLLLNPLPSQVRRRARLYVAGVAAPLGTGIGAGALFFMSSSESTAVVGLVAAIVAIVWLVVVVIAVRAYQSTLAEAVSTQRFGEYDDDPNEVSPDVVLDIAIKSLRGREPDTILFGFSLIDDLPAERLPVEVSSHVNSGNPEVRIAAASAVARLDPDTVVGELKWRLGVETDPEVLRVLLGTFLDVRPSMALARAKELIGHDEPSIRAVAAVTIMEAGDLAQVIEGATTLEQLVASPEPRCRVEAARALGSLKGGGFVGELGRLVEDPDTTVQLAALAAIGVRRDDALLPLVVENLGKSKATYFMVRFVASFGESALPIIERAYADAEPRVSVAQARVLVAVGGDAAEASLLKLAAAASPAAQTTIARIVAAYARRRVVGEALRRWAMNQLALQSRRAVAARQLAKQQPETDWRSLELQARANQISLRLLYLLAIATEPAPVLDAIPVLAPIRPGKIDVSDRAKAIEHLEVLAKEPVVRAAIEIIEGRNPSEPSSSDIKELFDFEPWLQWVDDHLQDINEERTVNTAQKVLVFRRSPLFQNLPGEVLLALSESTVVRDVQKDEVIFEANARADGFYMIRSGSVAIKHGDTAQVMLGKNAIFGELSLLGDGIRHRAAVAAEDGVLLFVESDTFDNLIEDVPDVLRALVGRVISYLEGAGEATQAEGAPILSESMASQMLSIPDTESSGPSAAAPDDKTRVREMAGFRRLSGDEKATLRAPGSEPILIRCADEDIEIDLGNAPRIVSVNRGEDFPLLFGTTVLGREESCDIVLTGAGSGLSRRHVEFEVESKESITVKNLSVNGTLIPVEAEFKPAGDVTLIGMPRPK